MPIIKREAPAGSLFAIYGIPGSGKSALAAALMMELHARTGKPALYADWENGASTIPERVPLELWNPGLGDTYDEVNDMTKCALDNDVSALVVDTISTMGTAILMETTKKGLTDGKETKRVTASSKGGHLIRIPTMMDYQVAQMAFEQWCISTIPLMRSGKHVVWLAHENLVEIKDAGGASKDVVGGPEIIGSKLTRSAPKLPKIIGRIRCSPGLQAGTSQRVFQTAVDGYWVSKDRLNVLPPRGFDLTITSKDGKPLDPMEIIERGRALWKTVLDGNTR